MRFLIVTHVGHKKKGNQWYAYSPYVREMNLWLKHVNHVEILAPTVKEDITAIDSAYQHKAITFTEVPAIAFISLKKSFLSLLALPVIIFKLLISCRKADHIHLRCPGNMGLLGCLIQILFPSKIKTAKYAGNWDPKAKQPKSYNAQKWILGNTFLARNMTVLVYGKWKKQSKNIKSFFTASFSNDEKQTTTTRSYSKTIKFVFVGSLVKGKRPLLAIQIVEKLMQKGYDVTLDIYGDGVLKEELEAHCKIKALQDNIRLRGNVKVEQLKEALKSAHFCILASKSEGWPKAIAEAMFFGVIPIATSVSCIPDMLDYGNRGLLIPDELEGAVLKIEANLQNEDALQEMSDKAMRWSQQYTLDSFEYEISKLLKKT